LLDELSPQLFDLLGDSYTCEILPGPEAGIVRADRTQVAQCLMTLVRCARDSMPGQGLLRIETGVECIEDAAGIPGLELPPGRYAAISISDDGAPLGEEARSRLFEPFYSGPRSAKGLAEAYGIARTSGGDLAVAESLLGGLRLTLRLPQVQEAPAPPEAATPPPSGPTILVAEDESGIRALVRKVLEKQRYRVVEAASAEEALQLAGAHPGAIELLVTDVVLPGLSGLELAARLKALRPGIRVLFISGYTDEDLTAALPPGARFLQKPFTLSSLVERVQSLAPWRG
jgi:hypothetical protein